MGDRRPSLPAQLLAWTLGGLALAAAWAAGVHEIAIAWVKGGNEAAALAWRLALARLGLLAAVVLTPPVSVTLGATAGAAVLAAQSARKERPMAAKAWAGVGGLALLPVAAFWLADAAAEALGVTRPGWRALVPWGLGAGLGVLAALAWLRWGAPAVDETRHRLSRRAALERNKKTDVRQIRSMLPAEIGRYDPTRYMRGKDIFVGLDENRRPVGIDLETWRLSHVLLSGRTRAGKGVAAQILLAQAIRAGELVVVLDPKGDEWLPHVLHAAAGKAGRPYRYIDLRPGRPPQIAPFAQAEAAEIETMLVAGFSLAERGEAADFYRLADRKAAREAAAIIFLGKSPREALEIGGSDWIERARGFHSALEEVAALDAIAAAETDWRAWAEKGGCLYVVGDALSPAVTRVQRMLAVRLLLLAKRMQEEGRPGRICLFADEFKWHISKPFMAALGMAAGWGLHCILAMQSLQDLADCPADLDRDAVRGAVMENCAIQISYAVADPETAEWLARSTGKIQVDDEMRRVERNVALAETVLPERTIRQSERYLIDENMFLMMPKACAVLRVPRELARFVFTASVAVEKDPAAVAVSATGGALAVTEAAGEAEDEAADATGGALAVSKAAGKEDFV